MLENHCTECGRIEENCTYTAETHHIIAKRQRSWYTFFQLIPAIVSAVAGTLVVGNIVPPWVGVAALIAAIVTAMGTVMNPQQGYFEHLVAAKAFTALKHDARALREAFGPVASDREGAILVRSLHDRYNELIRLTPPTDDWAFEKAQERIQKGVHTPDGKSQ